MKIAKTSTIAFELLTPWDKNPRTIDEVSFDRLKALIEGLGLFKPFLINQDNIILGGNMRHKVCKSLGIDVVPVSIVETKNETEMLAYALADNDRAGEYETEKLKQLILNNPTLDIKQYRVDLGKQTKLSDLLSKIDDVLREDFSKNLGSVLYEPKQTNHQEIDLFRLDGRFDRDIEKIENPGLRELFKARAYNFATFDFAKIADYYAYQATPEEQRMFEKLALILLDKNQLIENGFSKIITSLTDESDTFDAE